MRLLFIDDDLDCLRGLSNALKFTTHSFQLYSDPFEGFKAYEEGDFDVVITDYKMPGMNGIEILQAVREKDPNACVILLTGFADIENAIAAVNYGAYAFFRKPMDIEDFMGTLEKIENEINNKDDIDVNLNNLAVEYAKLKENFENLENVLREIAPKTKENLNNE